MYYKIIYMYVKEIENIYVIKNFLNFLCFFIID